MRYVRFKFILWTTLVVLLSSLALRIYIKQEEFISLFKKGLEENFSSIIGADVKIGSISGNIFSRVTLKDLNCRFKAYDVTIKTARLEYSLLDVISGRRPKEGGVETYIWLQNSSLRLHNNIIISKDINGKIRLAKDKIKLESLNFGIADILYNRLEGEIITNPQETLRIDLLLKAKPLFEKGKKLFSEVTISAKGPVDNLSLYGDIKGKDGADVLLNGYVLLAQGILNIGSQFSFKDPKIKMDTTLLMDTELDIKKATFNAVFIPETGRIEVNGDYSKWPILEASIKNDHIKLCGLDFSNVTNISSKVVLKERDFSYLILDIDTESSVLNYYPLNELEASFWIDKDVLRLIYLKSGDTVSATAALTIKQPRKVFLKINLADFDMTYPFFILGGQDEPPISGRLSGTITTQGRLDKLQTNVKFQADKGRMGTIDYNSMVLNAKGEGPYLNVYDSRIIRDETSLQIEGTADIRKIATERFMEDITVTTDTKTIIWEGWDISRVDEKGELRLGRELNGGLRVDFKTRMNQDETQYEPAKPQNEVGLEYKMLNEDGILKDGTLQFKAKEKEEFFGIMKKYKF